MNNAAKIERPHPPLARDSAGNLLPIPAGTVAWRICRETNGRPSELKGTDKQLIRFALDTTTDDLLELCGSGVYRVYGLDEIAKQLAHVATWDLTPGARELRNTAIESSLLAGRASSAPATDLRFVLEAMTHMMRTHTDALRIVAESHVDLAKAVVSAKGLPRNAAAIQHLLAGPRPEDDSDDDEEDEEEVRQPHWIELLMPLAEKAAEIVPGLVMAMSAQRSPAAQNDQRARETQRATNDDAELASRPKWEVRDLVDFGYAARKGQAKRAAREQPATSGISMAALGARVMADPALAATVCDQGSAHPRRDRDLDGRDRGNL